jgi:hypothetical protein
MNTSSDIQVTRSESIAALAAALSKAQGVMEGATKAGLNPHFKSKYADLASVWDACRKPLSDNGLSVVQLPGGDGQTLSVTTILMHESGEWIEGTMTMTPTKNDPQGVGSCLTYARRYALAATVGISPEDDDGNAASAKPIPPAKPVAKPEGYDDKLADLEAAADLGTEALKMAWLGLSGDVRAAIPVGVRGTLKDRAAKVQA